MIQNIISIFVCRPYVFQYCFLRENKAMKNEKLLHKSTIERKVSYESIVFKSALFFGQDSSAEKNESLLLL